MPPTIASVVVTPTADTLEYVGDTVQLTASAADANGQAISASTFTWSSSDSTVATVNASGLVAAVSRGSAVVTATVNGQAGTAGIEVAVRFTGLSAGRAHACGVTAKGTTYCWGDDSVGQLGDGSNTASMQPVLVAGGHRFARLAGGSRDYTCALTAAGEAYCWGQNGLGQLGDGTTTSSNQPVRAAPGLTFSDLSAGDYHTCGVTTAGSAYCWGGNAAVSITGYALGAPTTDVCANPEAPFRGSSWPCSPTPVAVSGAIAFQSISAGILATCGLAESGQAYCWGWNAYDELGNSSDTDATAPTMVAGGLEFTRLRLGGGHGCGLAGGAAYCWGAVDTAAGLLRENYGQLGTGSFDGTGTPAPVVGGLSFVEVVPSGANDIYTFTCGLTAAGAAYCWGANEYGELGTDTTIPSCGTWNNLPLWCSNVPVPVAGGIVFTSLALGQEFACGVDTSGIAYCWGRNDFGQLGDGTTTDRSTPVQVVPLP